MYKLLAQLNGMVSQASQENSGSALDLFLWFAPNKRPPKLAGTVFDYAVVTVHQ
jgi:hypothetical protein